MGDAGQRVTRLDPVGRQARRGVGDRRVDGDRLEQGAVGEVLATRQDGIGATLRGEDRGAAGRAAGRVGRRGGLRQAIDEPPAEVTRVNVEEVISSWTGIPITTLQEDEADRLARMEEILRWVATQISAGRVLVFLSSWDGRYYWDYPLYRASERMGGEAGFRRLVKESRQLGFRMMPMFGANAANRRQPAFQRVADAATRKVDGDVMDLNWVDWDNDRHQEGWLAYMNLGVDSWRQLLTERIADAIERYGVDAYFLDIIGGWVNNTRGDMHEGARCLVADLRDRYPHVLACGEMLYDALLGFIPLYQASNSRYARKYARFFSHLSHPAPGRGSSGVHESGFGRWDPERLGLRPGTIPTLNVVDDTFTTYREAMAAVIAKDPNVDHFLSRVGNAGSRVGGNSGFFFITLKDRSKRRLDADGVIQELRRKTAQVPGIGTYFQNPPPIRIGGGLTKASDPFTPPSPHLAALHPPGPRLRVKPAPVSHPPSHPPAPGNTTPPEV